jgi:acyl carrier protein phosphodiesterase
MGGNLKLSCGCSERIILHRAIDTFTDAHPVFDKVLKLHSRYHHYAGVIVDVFYDHFLAKNWTTYSNENLSILLLSTNL